jgi:hypothetical protein
MIFTSTGSRVRVAVPVGAAGGRGGREDPRPALPATTRIRPRSASRWIDRWRLRGWPATAVLALAAATFAPSVTAVEWDSLSQAQRHVLGAYRAQWSALPEERRERLALGAERWSAMDPVARRAVREKYRAWQRLPPERRDELLTRFEAFRTLGPEQQHALRERQQRFRGLPPDRQRQLRERFRELPAEERGRAFDRLRRDSGSVVAPRARHDERLTAGDGG